MINLPEMLATVITFLGAQIGTVLTTITGNAILLIPVGVFVFGAVIGLVHRLIRG